MSVSAEPTNAPQIDFELPDEQSLSEQLAGCLQFSSAFTSVGFETINDSVLREMNERATHQLTQTEATAASLSQQHTLPSPPLASTRDEWQSPFELRNFQKMTTSPPHSHFSEAHNRQFAKSEALQLSPQAKRLGEGEESPSKRRRAPDGKSVDILHSPTQSLQQISLNASNQIAQASASRQRERHRKELQTSPRRRGQLPGRRVSSDNTASSSSSFGATRSHETVKLNSDTTPDLKPPSGLLRQMPGAFPGMFGALPSSRSSNSLPSNTVPGATPASTNSAPHHTALSSNNQPPNIAMTSRLPSSRSMRFEQSQRSVSNPSIRPSPSQNDIKNFTTSPLGRKPLINTIAKQSIRPMSYHVTPSRTAGPTSGEFQMNTSTNSHSATTSTHSSLAGGTTHTTSSLSSGRIPRTSSSRQVSERPRIPSSQSMRQIPKSTSTRALPSSGSSRQLSASLDPRTTTVSRGLSTSQSMHQIPRSQSSRTLPPISQRSVSSSATNTATPAAPLAPNNSALPSYARPTVASLRYAQATQMSRTSDQLNPGRVRR